MESIREFLVEYLGNGDYNKDDDYYIIQDCVIVNFFTDWGKPERNDQIICQFIYDLNVAMQSEAFVSYTVFLEKNECIGDLKYGLLLYGN